MTDTQTRKALRREDLAQFTGTDQWYRHPLVRSVLFTDGVKYLAETGGAFWLLDEIALAQRYDPAVAKQEFQLWILSVDLAKSTAALRCEDGDGNLVMHKLISFTDFPLDEIRFYVTGNVIMLPSEY